MPDMATAIMQRILDKGTLPSLSPITLRLIRMAADDDANARELTSLISQDPGLTTRLLRMANSPAFRRLDHEISSISKAVVFLGLRELRIMALSLSLRDALPVKKGGPDYHLFWRACLHRAVLAREVARRLAVPEVEEAFVAGLVQEIGLPLLLRALTPEEAKGFPGMGARLRRQLAWERQRWGLDHRQVGVQVLEHWGLPRVLVQCQHLLSEDERDKAPLLQEIADFARRGTEAFFLPEVHLTDIYQIAWRYFGFDDEAVNVLLATTLVYVGEAADALEVKLDQEADLLEVMEQANRALSRLSSQLQPHVQALVADSSCGTRPDPVKEQERFKDQVVSQTLDAVVHEIRNPLMSVGGFARRLAGQVQGGERLRRYAEVIVAEAARLDQVLTDINRLLTPYHPCFSAMDLAECLQRMADGLDEPEISVCGEAAMRVKWHLPGAPVAMAGDPQGLATALRQVVGYGCHLMLGEHPQGTMHVHLQASPRDVVISLLGPGLPPVQGQDPLAERSFGPALSLAQARRVVEAHQGSVALASTTGGKGFLLTVRLPRKPQPAQVAQPA